MVRVRTFRIALSVLPALVLSIHVSSCTIIGLVAGSAIDHGSADKSPRVLTVVSYGTPLRLHLRDGTKVSGDYLGRGKLPSDRHARYWSAWKDTATQSLPALNDSIGVGAGSSDPQWGRLRSYDLDSLFLDQGGTVRGASFRQIRSIADSAGRSVDLLSLQTAIRHASLPLETTLILANLSHRDTIPVNEIQVVEGGPTRNAGKVIGLLVGLGVDIAILSSGGSSSSSSGGGGGCENPEIWNSTGPGGRGPGLRPGSHP